MSLLVLYTANNSWDSVSRQYPTPALAALVGTAVRAPLQEFAAPAGRRVMICTGPTQLCGISRFVVGS